MQTAARPCPAGYSQERWKQIIARDEEILRLRKEGKANFEIVEILGLSGMEYVRKRLRKMQAAGINVASPLTRSELQQAIKRFHGPAYGTRFSRTPRQVAQRKCLYCGHMRDSTGPHDRLHPDCKYKATAGIPFWSGDLNG